MARELTDKDAKDIFYLMIAMAEGKRALSALSDLRRLASYRHERAPGVVAYEFEAVFDSLRVMLQCAGVLTKLYWPVERDARARGVRLRSLAGLPDQHPLDRSTLRNHFEHIDERIDRWLLARDRSSAQVYALVPRGAPEGLRKAVADRALIIFDVDRNTVSVLSDDFDLDELEGAVLDTFNATLRAMTTLTEDWGKHSG